MFCGVGGFRLGLERANLGSEELQAQGGRWHGNERTLLDGCGSEPPSEGGSDSGKFRCVWSNDWDKYTCRVYRGHWSDGTLHEGNVEAVDADGLPDFDLLTAGFPCQSFSFAGRRKGFGDVRGTLFFSVARVAEAKRPKVVLLENVKGLLSAQRGYCFYTVLRVLEELGYWVEWQVLNSRHFGVPQNRERVFVVGHLGDRGGREIFPLMEAGGISGQEDGSKQAPEEGVRSDDFCVANTLEAGYGKMKSLTNTVANTLSSRYGRDGAENLIAQALQTDGYLRSGSSFGTSIPQSGRNIRRLTPTECERLQGFPDGWTQTGTDAEGNTVEVSDTQRYKMLGNAVTVNVVGFLGRRIMERCFSG